MNTDQKTEDKTEAENKKKNYNPCLTTLTLWKPSRKFTLDRLRKTERLRVWARGDDNACNRVRLQLDFWSPTSSGFSERAWAGSLTGALLVEPLRPVREIQRIGMFLPMASWNSQQVHLAVDNDVLGSLQGWVLCLCDCEVVSRIFLLRLSHLAHI